MKIITDIQVLEGVKVLLRVDFNVPIKNGVVADDFRIKNSVPTIEYLTSRGARVILISHLESSSGDNDSLEPIAAYLNKIGHTVTFVKKLSNAQATIENELKNGHCVLLENLRTEEGEKNNDKKFAKQLASLADIYVNDAFSVSHREHASIVGVPLFLPSYAGLQLEKEIANLSRAFKPAHPFLFILCGAKFETKLPLLEKFMVRADTIFIGGALANDFFKEKGYEVGTSLVSKGNIDLSIYARNAKLIVPVDVITDKKEVKKADALNSDDAAYDAGPETLAVLKDHIDNAKFILWNGPLGMYEQGYTAPTQELAKMIGEATRAGSCESVVGGGDTLAAIATLGIEDKITFVSTGGGAMLDFLAKETLPGIQALDESAKRE